MCASRSLPIAAALAILLFPSYLLHLRFRCLFYHHAFNALAPVLSIPTQCHCDLTIYAFHRSRATVQSCQTLMCLSLH
jgi:hypothetical protein